MITLFYKIISLRVDKSGTGHFLYQRLTSLANIPLIGFFIWQVISLNGQPYDVVVERLSSPLVMVVMLLVMVSSIFHMKLGMEMVIEDYVHGDNKEKLLTANKIFSGIIGIICILAILKLGFYG